MQDSEKIAEFHFIDTKKTTFYRQGFRALRMFRIIESSHGGGRQHRFHAGEQCPRLEPVGSAGREGMAAALSGRAEERPLGVVTGSTNIPGQ